MPAWLAEQPTYLEMVFVVAESAEAPCRFPVIEGMKLPTNLISDEGAVIRPSAFIMCLYALVDFREWSLRLARPAFSPIRATNVRIISNNRAGFSKMVSRLNR
jgi:hypothetical protein